MNVSASTLDGSPHAGRASAAWCLLLLLIGSVLIWETGHRGVDPDEFEHLHAAYSVSRGEVPYRDFFEHHAPALYYVLQPLFWIFGPEWTVLTGGRLFSLACAGGVLFLTARIARRMFGVGHGLLAAALLASTTIFHLKGLELRPDVPAMLLLLLGLETATCGTGTSDLRWSRFFVEGVLCGLATVFTQKAVVPAAGLALGMLGLAAWQSALQAFNWRRMFGGALAFAAGGLAVWGVIFGLFALAGAAGHLWHSVFYQLWVWDVKSGRVEHLRPTLAADLSVWLAALCEIGMVLREIRRRETWETGRGVVVVAAAVCLLSLAVVKATFPQFYLLWFPWLVLLAARRWKIWFETVARREWFVALAVGVLAIVGWEAFLIQRTLEQPRGGSLEHLLESSLLSSESLGSAWLPILLLLLSSAVVGYFLGRNPRSAALAVIAVGGMTYGQLRILDAVWWSQTPQRRLVEAVNATAGTDGTVLDGFTGYGALRRHAYYFWWINEYSIALMKPEQRNEGLLQTLEKNPPAVVLFDRHLRLLPAPVVSWLEANYQPAEQPIWKRKNSARP